MKFRFGLVLGAVLAAGAAQAADMSAPVYRKAPVMAPAYNWSGCYGGIEGGGTWGNARSLGEGINNGVPIAIPAGTLKSNGDLSGGLVGGTLGCNYQVDQWVFGVEGDGSWSGSRGSAVTLLPFNPAFSEDHRSSWLATVRGRVGYAVGGNVLLYGTAGGAFTDLQIHEFSAANPGQTETRTLSGWTAGGGVEWGFAPNWSAKVEYLYLDLGRQTYFVTSPTGCCTMQSTHVTDNLVRVGVNYHFNWGGPLVARY